MVPGSVLPAALAYPPLIAALGDQVEVVAKELEVYAGPTPPANYSLDDEVAGILRVAEERGWDAFDLIGYSGGGASALAFTVRHPDRLTTLTLLEPAWAGNWDDMSAAHRALQQEYEKLEGRPPGEFMREFQRLGVRPGVVLPPPPTDQPPPWMALRPAGIGAFIHTFKTYDLDREALARFDKPVLCVLGALSNPDDYGEIAERLGRVFTDYRLEVFADRHHFDPPHRVEPDRLAALLWQFWNRADAT